MKKIVILETRKTREKIANPRGSSGKKASILKKTKKLTKTPIYLENGFMLLSNN